MTTTTLSNKTTIAFIRSEQSQTPHGQRTIIHCTNYGDPIKIIRGANDPYAATLFTGDFIPVIERNGKYELDKEVIAGVNESADTPQPKSKVELLAETMGDCVRAMKKQLPEVDDELIQKYAVAIFIQATKK